MKSESAELVSGLIRQYRRLRLLYLGYLAAAVLALVFFFVAKRVTLALVAASLVYHLVVVRRAGKAYQRAFVHACGQCTLARRLQDARHTEAPPLAEGQLRRAPPAAATAPQRSPPSLGGMGGQVGRTSPSSVKHQLDKRGRLGLVRRDPKRPRAMEVVGADSAPSGRAATPGSAHVSSLDSPSVPGVEDGEAGVLEALRASGASWWQVVFQGVVPEKVNEMLSWTFIRFEINFVNAVAVGAVAGAGGIGYQLFLAGSFYYNIHEVGLIVYLCLAVAVVLEVAATQLRKRYIVQH